MPRITVSEWGRVTTKTSGRTLYMRTQSVSIETRKITLVAADPKDPSWSKLSLLPVSDILSRNIKASLRKQGFPPAFVPECSPQRVVIGFRADINTAEVTPDLLESLGFSQPKLAATTKKQPT